MSRKVVRRSTVTGFAALALAVAAPEASADEIPGCAIWADTPSSPRRNLTCSS